MSVAADRKERRPYEPPRIVLPNEKGSAPEGKATSPAEGFGPVGTSFGPS